MMLKADGLDGAVIGRGRRCSHPDILVYDAEKCVEILAKQLLENDPEISEEEAYDQARDHFEFSVVGSWVGEETPIFVHLASLDEIEEEEE